jgi:hypothetical protein
VNYFIMSQPTGTLNNWGKMGRRGGKLFLNLRIAN